MANGVNILEIISVIKQAVHTAGKMSWVVFIFETLRTFLSESLQTNVLKQLAAIIDIM